MIDDEMKVLGVDVSGWQPPSEINYHKMRLSGVQHMVVKASEQARNRAAQAHYAGATAAGIPTATYHFATAIKTPKGNAKIYSDAIDAIGYKRPSHEAIMRIGWRPDEWVDAWIDVERADPVSSYSGNAWETFDEAWFVELMEELHRLQPELRFGFYTNYVFYNLAGKSDRWRKYPVWWADYSAEPWGYDPPFAFDKPIMWQFDSTTPVAGYAGRIDRNWLLIDPDLRDYVSIPTELEAGMLERVKTHQLYPGNAALVGFANEDGYVPTFYGEIPYPDHISPTHRLLPAARRGSPEVIQRIYWCEEGRWDRKRWFDVTPEEWAAISAVTPAPERVESTTHPVLFGLHASANDDIPDGEFPIYQTAKIELITVLSGINPHHLARLVRENPDAKFIVRAMLDMFDDVKKEPRNITPQQFFNDTVNTVRRCAGIIGNHGRLVGVQLHNEPNLMLEGFGGSWHSASSFNVFIERVLAQYQLALPGVKMLYPALSPGDAIGGVRPVGSETWLNDPTTNVVIARCDAITTHAYWGAAGYSPQTAADEVRRLHLEFPDNEIWVTEASHNQGAPSAQMGAQYVEFWQRLQQVPMVKGVTYFVASSQFGFEHETWLNRPEIAQIAGNRLGAAK